MRTIHIFSPHIDDAFLSLGGCIKNWRDQQSNIKVYNIFTISDWTTPGSLSGLEYKRDVNTVTALRKAEESLTAAYGGFEFEFWDFLDYPLRQKFNENQSLEMEAQIFSRIETQMNTEDHFFFPLGMHHPDHLMINRISNRFAGKGFKLFNFEDMPYFGWAGADYRELYVSEKRTKTPYLERIDLKNKIDGLKSYKSQVHEDWFRLIMAYAYNSHDNEFYERYWKVN